MEAKDGYYSTIPFKSRPFTVYSAHGELSAVRESMYIHMYVIVHIYTCVYAL
jgi:hypothetical protein